VCTVLLWPDLRPAQDDHFFMNPEVKVEKIRWNKELETALVHIVHLKQAHLLGKDNLTNKNVKWKSVRDS
jgi:hypothetical protein